jgi:N-acetylated-alpha-linked acidic dipeptidase
MVMCRYGYSFRGNKIKNAQNYGVKGVLLFDDPFRNAPNGTIHMLYPNGQFLPSDGTQRGTIYTKEGDPLTPIYPSTGNVIFFVRHL